MSTRLAESNRVEAFSDGVFAIALTLLVLDLHAPEGESGHFARALLDQWQSYAAFLAAFLNISATWLNHHDLFTRVRRVDTSLMCANLALLLITPCSRWWRTSCCRSTSSCRWCGCPPARGGLRDTTRNHEDDIM